MGEGHGSAFGSVVVLEQGHRPAHPLPQLRSEGGAVVLGYAGADPPELHHSMGRRLSSARWRAPRARRTARLLAWASPLASAPGASCSAASACSCRWRALAAAASASSSALALRIHSSRLSLLLQLLGELIAPFVFAELSVFLGIKQLGPTQQRPHLAFQLLLALEHPLVAHGLVLTGIGFHLGAIQRHLAQAMGAVISPPSTLRSPAYPGQASSTHPSFSSHPHLPAASRP